MLTQPTPHLMLRVSSESLSGVAFSIQASLSSQETVRDKMREWEVQALLERGSATAANSGAMFHAVCELLPATLLKR
jgi:hypothetical protein